MPLFAELRRSSAQRINGHTASDTRDFFCIHGVTIGTFDARVFGGIVRIDLAVEFNGFLELFVFLSLFTSEAAWVCLFTKIISVPKKEVIV